MTDSLVERRKGAEMFVVIIIILFQVNDV